MFKISKNPVVAQLEASHRGRTISLTEIKPIKLEDGTRLCAWCAETPIVGAHNKKYCSSACIEAIEAWAYPQKENGLAQLLSRQNYLCAVCGYDWNPLADSLLGRIGIPKSLNKLTQFNHRFIKAFKNRAGERKPEVDHVIPIYKGGQAIGFSNHQAICSVPCHREKTRIDNSGKKIRK